MLVNDEKGCPVTGCEPTAVPNRSAVSVLLSTNSLVSRVASSRFRDPIIAWKPSGGWLTDLPERDTSSPMNRIMFVALYGGTG